MANAQGRLPSTPACLSMFEREYLANLINTIFAFFTSVSRMASLPQRGSELCLRNPRTCTSSGTKLVESFSSWSISAYPANFRKHVHTWSIVRQMGSSCVRMNGLRAGHTPDVTASNRF